MNTLDAEHKGEMGSCAGNGRLLEWRGADCMAEKVFFGLPAPASRMVNFRSIPLNRFVEK